MALRKIFNDPIYGLVSFPFDFLYVLIDHPFFQRLRRIQQLGMSSVVYPGATHTRLHHALGAMHLCDRLLAQLRRKDIEITEEEYEATLIATLLHDIGHGPYSHALEGAIIPLHHEEVGIIIMKRLNEEYSGRLTLAIEIFEKRYHKKFLSQVISGQIDVDRMDYLSRDSFYTGVAEGIIGYDRLIKMMDVKDHNIVIEEKGIHSAEKFLLSRYFMYQQVYLHHASLSADHMLKTWLTRYKKRILEDPSHVSSQLDRLISIKSEEASTVGIDLFLDLDDTDIIQAIKRSRRSKDPILASLSSDIINRRLHSIISEGKPLEDSKIEQLTFEVSQDHEVDQEVSTEMINLGHERIHLYDQKDEVKILLKKTGEVVTLSSKSRLNLRQSPLDLFFVTFPRMG